MIMPWEEDRICEDCQYWNGGEYHTTCVTCKSGSDWQPSESARAVRNQETTVKDSGDRTQFSTGAVRDMHEGKGRCDLLPPLALLRLARHFESGAVKYGDRNWEKGIPCHSFIDSALRHMFKYMAGNTDEDHLIAALWNIACLAETEEKRPVMMDIPARMENNK